MTYNVFGGTLNLALLQLVPVTTEQPNSASPYLSHYRAPLATYRFVNWKPHIVSGHCGNNNLAGPHT